MAGYQTGTGNELLSDGIYNYTYDADGNMTSQTNIATGSVTYYTWDYRNRLIEVKQESSNGTVLNDEKFTYDVNNNRIAVSLNGTPELYTVYDGANPYMDFNGSGQLTQRYLYNPNALSQFYGQVSASGAVQWFLTDNINSIRQVVSSNGNVLDAITYDPYGNILSQTNAANAPRFLYTGGVYDSELGIYYYRMRYYDPATGRFESQDPLGFAAGDSNLYRYVRNAPTDLADPSGEDWSDWVVSHLPQSWVNYLGSHDSDLIGNTSNFFAGWGDTLSFGVTSYVRQWGGWDAVNYNSGAYFYGQLTGTGHGLSMMGINGGTNIARQMGGARGGLWTGVGRYFRDGRNWNTVRRMWSGHPPILRTRGWDLHHVIFPQRWAVGRGGWIPDRFVNAGFNYMPMGAWRNRVWMNWGAPVRPLEWAYRMGYVSQFNPLVNPWFGRYPGSYYFESSVLDNAWLPAVISYPCIWVRVFESPSAPQR